MDLTKLSDEKLRRKYRDYRRNREREEAVHIKEPCFACGEDDPDVLDYHHLDPEEKTGQVFELARKGHLGRAAEEAEKCVVLCANCHRKLHARIRTQEKAEVEAEWERRGLRPLRDKPGRPRGADKN